MKETPEQYRSRMLGHVAGNEALKMQAAAPKKLEALLKRAPASKVRKRPAPGKWSVTEILTHLADAEVATAWRIRMIVSTPGVPIQAFDQDAWVAALHYDKRSARESLRQFRALREANLALLKALTPEQWKHAGIHSERGEESVEMVARMMAGHDVNHIKQIEAILSAKKP